MKYRADIDGLRAIAVVSVILAHAGFTQVSGGFLGVDVFFVISGYLITSIVRNGLEQGKFSLLHFYERRARRILPGLLLVIVACIPFALWLMLPDYLQNFAQSVVATLLFANNVLLALTSGYWSLESSFKPLLHTWSLGVEEQFYVLFPVCLLLVFRFGRRAQIFAIASAAVASFVMSEYGWRHFPDVNFYLATSRAWELMAGSLASYVNRKPRALDHATSLGALAAIVLSMIVFGEHTPSPSYFSAVPVLGTVGILLFDRPGTIAHRVLALRPVLFVGLVSYSAYLWHQPVFAFARLATIAPPGRLEMAGLTVLVFALAVLSWKYVETPMRNAKAVPLRRFAPMAFFATASLVAFGLALHFDRGLPEWTFPNVSRADDVYIAYNSRIRRFEQAAFPENGLPNLVLIGDSYGRDVGNVLLESGALKGRNLIYLEDYPTCEAGGSECAIMRKADLVIIALDQHELLDPASLAANRQAERSGVRAMLTAISHETSAPAIMFGSKNFGWNINPFGRVPMTKRTEAYAQVPPAQVVLNDDMVAMLPRRQYIDTIRLLGIHGAGDGHSIRFFDDDGRPLAPDRWHLTRYGARYLAGVLSRSQSPAWAEIVNAQRRTAAINGRGGTGALPTS